MVVGLVRARGDRVLPGGDSGCPPVRLFRGGEEVTEVVGHHPQQHPHGAAGRDGPARARRRLSLRGREDRRGRRVDGRRRVRRGHRARSATSPKPRCAAASATLEDGVYRVTSWTEWDDDFFRVPCALTVDGDRLVFDFEGASPQTHHFFNSKPYIIESELVGDARVALAPDLPFNDGIFAPARAALPRGHGRERGAARADRGRAHGRRAERGRCRASRRSRSRSRRRPTRPQRRWLTGAGFEIGARQQPVVVDAARRHRRRVPRDRRQLGRRVRRHRPRRASTLGRNLVGRPARGAFPDIEVLESWYPLLFSEKRARPGGDGAGVHRAGGGNRLGFRPHGIDEMTGTMFGMRRWLPLPGWRRDAGRDQRVPRPPRRRLGRAGRRERVRASRSEPDDWFEMRLPNGGGFGDPLDRDPAAVGADIERGSYSRRRRRRACTAWSSRRAAPSTSRPPTRTGRDARRGGSRRALPATARPLTGDGLARCAATADDDAPLYPGVVQRGAVAVSARRAARRSRWLPIIGPTAVPVLVEHPVPTRSRGRASAPTWTRAPADALHTEVALEPARRGRSRSSPDAGGPFHARERGGDER